ncbi:hypothetical protein CHLRE_07g336900v5 [Chlamydomonas reinhardtii]|uniref:Uncharacterized protein n=1 Tax=Chlamydomonas reinhardtii TaxID=3055 RepID=A8JCH2_CHLRE|nr:uncharacterized protein CHLRE_07g336900v5 [Chlamydomonas reinhardtii]PNW80956.1 hypothetical protein CHLRE_07g336900v5 [Chlamydomonas reinhardtii]|eukprot:XP_001700134.1 predicted protein [Chlamydomonas reinhardtii]
MESGLELEPELAIIASSAFSVFVARASPNSEFSNNAQGAWQGWTSCQQKGASCADVDSIDASSELKAPCDSQESMQDSVMGLPGFLASFMQTAWAGERALGGATLVGGELVGVPVDVQDASKKFDDPPSKKSAEGTHVGVLRHCISEPQPCRVLRSCSSGSGRSLTSSTASTKTSPEYSPGWLLLHPNAATTSFGGLTLVGGEFVGVAEADDVTVTITVRKLKGAKAD